MDPRRFGLSDQDLEALGYRVKPKGASTMGTPSPKETPWGTDLPSSEGSTEAPDRAPGASGDPGRRRWVWTVVLLAALAWTSSSYRHLPDPVSANRPDTVFSSARAMAQLVEIAQAPRPTGSPEHDRVMRYLVDRLTYLGLDPEVQTATVVRRADGSAVAATVRNVVARLPGSAPTGAVGLAAHYDGVPLSHAAADDGVGVVAILETLRAVTAGA
ncbi:MAG TPA: M28 family peptidase, partial [Longimicrobiales bacterium]|nr:M28 family peptidase [Longimicrobiales bacterium]